MKFALLLILNFKFCIALLCNETKDEKRSEIFEKTKFYCDKMNDWRLKDAVGEGIIMDIQDLFVDTKAYHYNDINNTDSITVAIYLDKWYNANIEIKCSILIDESEIKLVKCDKELFYSIPIKKNIFNKETKHKYEVYEILYFENKSLKIDCILSHSSNICTQVENPTKPATEEVNKGINNVINLGNSLFKSEQYNKAKNTFETVLRENPDDSYSKKMINKINEKSLSVEDEINIAIDNAYSGNSRKMILAFKTLYLYQDHKLVVSNSCLYFFMANMLEFYSKELNLNLSERDRAYCVKQYVDRSCAAGCPKTQEFIESLNVKYRIKYSIRCN